MWEWGWNPWNLSLGQAVSLFFGAGYFIYVSVQLLNELIRIRRTLEAIASKLDQRWSR